MGKLKEKIEFFCLITTGIASILSVISIFVGYRYISVIAFMSVLLLFFVTMVHNRIKYKEFIIKHDALQKQHDELVKRHTELNEFNDFIGYLLDNPRHNFLLLPKICLAIDKSKARNNLYTRELFVKHTYDMIKIDTSKTLKKIPLSYHKKIEHTLIVENKNLPDNYVYHYGITNSKNFKISQKHGNQLEFEEVNLNPYNNATNFAVVRSCEWPLYPSFGSTFPMHFKLEWDTLDYIADYKNILLYPMQYATYIELINFEIVFESDKQLLKKVELFKILKRTDGFNYIHVPIPYTQSNPNMNTTKFTIPYDNKNDKAYHIKIYWELKNLLHNTEKL